MWLVMDTDPWWKRLIAHALRRPVWHQMGYVDKTYPDDYSDTSHLGWR